ncbi:MAG: N-acetyltransferase [Chloroflexi bacterium]|nr:N-acetyltransferase [Chloroflexota bacterium]
MPAPTVPAIRFATEDDLPAILRIYNDAILTTVATWDEGPWTMERRREWWAEHQADALTPVIVAEAGGEVAGMAYLSRMSQKSGWRFTLEDTIYVDPGHHGQGVGRALLGELLELARKQGTHVVVASITSSNEASIALHKALGFEYIGEIREAGWKFGQRHSTTYWQRILD